MLLLVSVLDPILWSAGIAEIMERNGTSADKG